MQGRKDQLVEMAIVIVALLMLCAAPLGLLLVAVMMP